MFLNPSDLQKINRRKSSPGRIFGEPNLAALKVKLGEFKEVFEKSSVKLKKQPRSLDQRTISKVELHSISLNCVVYFVHSLQSRSFLRILPKNIWEAADPARQRRPRSSSQARCNRESGKAKSALWCWQFTRWFKMCAIKLALSIRNRLISWFVIQLCLSLPRSYTTSFSFFFFRERRDKLLESTEFSFCSNFVSCVVRPDTGCGWFNKKVIIVTFEPRMWCFWVVSVALLLIHPINHFII